MTIESMEITAGLDDVIGACSDSGMVYHRAAQSVHDESLKTVFIQYEDQRMRFVSALLGEARRLGTGPQPAARLSASGTAEARIKTAPAAQGALAALAACVRSEDRLEAAYRMASAAQWAPETRRLLEDQRRCVEKAQERLRASERSRLQQRAGDEILAAACRRGFRGVAHVGHV